MPSALWRSPFFCAGSTLRTLREFQHNVASTGRTPGYSGVAFRPQMKRQTSHIPQLDGIRGIAIALVIIWHYGSFFVTEPGSWGHAIQSTVRMSWSGVDLFFVLSGFLIGGILMDSREATNFWSAAMARNGCLWRVSFPPACHRACSWTGTWTGANRRHCAGFHPDGTFGIADSGACHTVVKDFRGADHGIWTLVFSEKISSVIKRHDR